VLRKGGLAIFQEPVRNSQLLRFLRRLIPYQAPDVSPFERPLTDQELATYADGFSSYESKAFLLPTTSLVNAALPGQRRLIHACIRMDAAFLRHFPGLAYYSMARVVRLIK